MQITISLEIKFFLKKLFKSFSPLISTTCVFEYRVMDLAKVIGLYFLSIFSPAAYTGHKTTRSEFLKEDEKSLFKNFSLEYL